MKKYFLSLMLLFIMTTSNYASEPLCNNSERFWAHGNRFFDTHLNNTDTVGYFIDTESIKIDKSKKIIKVWVFDEVSANGRYEFVKIVGDRFNSLAYMKYLYIIDYGNMQINQGTAFAIKCDGTIIESSQTQNTTWQDIPPGTMIEGLTKVIMKKYNLK